MRGAYGQIAIFTVFLLGGSVSCLRTNIAPAASNNLSKPSTATARVPSSTVHNTVESAQDPRDEHTPMSLAPLPKNCLIASQEAVRLKHIEFSVAGELVAESISGTVQAAIDKPQVDVLVEAEGLRARGQLRHQDVYFHERLGGDHELWIDPGLLRLSQVNNETLIGTFILPTERMQFSEPPLNRREVPCAQANFGGHQEFGFHHFSATEKRWVKGPEPLKIRRSQGGPVALKLNDYQGGTARILSSTKKQAQVELTVFQDTPMKHNIRIRGWVDQSRLVDSWEKAGSVEQPALNQMGVAESFAEVPTKKCNSPRPVYVRGKRGDLLVAELVPEKSFVLGARKRNFWLEGTGVVYNRGEGFTRPIGWSEGKQPWVRKADLEGCQAARPWRVFQ